MGGLRPLLVERRGSGRLPGGGAPHPPPGDWSLGSGRAPTVFNSTYAGGCAPRQHIVHPRLGPHVGKGTMDGAAARSGGVGSLGARVRAHACFQAANSSVRASARAEDHASSTRRDMTRAGYAMRVVFWGFHPDPCPRPLWWNDAGPATSTAQRNCLGYKLARLAAADGQPMGRGGAMPWKTIQSYELAWATGRRQGAGAAHTRRRDMRGWLAGQLRACAPLPS